MKRVFKVLDELKNPINFKELDPTLHWSDERKERHKKIVEIIGNGKYMTSFLVDTAHPNGYEIHNIFDNGIILIQNERTQKVVTELIARPQQLKRYWKSLGRLFPYEMFAVFETAKIH